MNASVQSDQDEDVVAKFEVQVMWKDDIRYAYNANSDAAVKKFQSPDALDNMIPYAEKVKGDDLPPTGFGRFSGRIGGGALTITINADDGKQIKVDLPINGGPKFKQGLTGAGSWQRA